LVSILPGWHGYIMARSGVLIILTRTPVAGKTKTRLIPALGAEGAVRLHRKMLLRTIEIACQSDFTRCELHAWPDTQHDFLQQLSVQFPVGIYAQKGKNLGERMCNAVTRALTRYDFVVIVGCDIPLLNLPDLNHAHAILQQQQADAVLGPSEDGGYYLIGMDRAEPSLFQGLRWGSVDVVDYTRTRLAECGWCWKETSILWDVDDHTDLVKLQHCPGFENEWQMPV